MPEVLHMMEHPIVPIYRYEPNAPPFYIPIEHEILGSMAGLVASSIANEIGDRAYQNAPRMLCYNLLVDCNFQNENIQEAYKLIVGAITLNLLKNGPRNVLKMIQDDVGNILTLFTSNLISRYHELKSICSPQLISAAQQNQSTFNNLKQEILNMYQTMPNQGMPMQNQGMPMQHQMPMQNQMMPMFQNNAPVYHQGMQVFLLNGIPVYQNGVPVQVQNNGGVVYQNNQPMQHPQMQQPVYQNNMPHQGMPVQQPQVAYNNNNASTALKEQRHGALIKPLERVVQTPVQLAPVRQEPVVVVEKPFSIEPLQITGGSEMERAKHRITLLGQNLVLPVQERIKEFNSSVDEFCNVIKEKDTDLVIMPSSVYPTIISNTNLDSAINSVKILKLKSKAENDSKSIFRCYSLITEPIAYCNSKRLADTMAILSKSDRLDNVARALQDIARSINLAVIVGDDEIVLNFITAVNIKLTAIVNSFLRNELRLNINIDDFIEDGDGLEKFLSSKFSILYKHVYLEFGKKVTTWLFHGDGNELTDNEFDSPTDVTVGFTNTLCSITLIDITSQELGVELDHKSYYIDPKTAPLIYSLVNTLSIHDVDEQLSTLDVLVASDGVRYRLYRDYLGDGKFLISKL